MPNPGRLEELLLPGSHLLLAENSGDRGKTDYHVLGVIHEGESILLDTRLSNRIVEEAVVRGELSPFRSWAVARREFSWEDSRFDFLLERKNLRCILEVKACTLVQEGRALFPDAPTTRGRRHVITLARAVKRGYRACVLFTVHRRGAGSFLANSATDPDFSDSLDKAMRVGVEVYAYECCWKDREARVGRQIPVVSKF